MTCTDDCTCNDEMLEGFTVDDEAPVFAFDPRRRTNAQLIADLVTLGFLHDGQSIIDLTYGERGAFWKRWYPPGLVTNDLDDGTDADYHFDFRDPPPRHWGLYDVVVYDPPYGYRGTSRLESDQMYGIDGAYVSPDDRDRLILGGMNGARLCVKPGGLVLVKCQQQTVSGKKRHQPFMVARKAEALGLEYVMELHVFSHRKQPAGVEQRLVHQNFSTALLFRAPK